MKTWSHMDKSEWKGGEWDNEPDKAQWDFSGLDCLIVRNRVGALCGYVGVPESHPYFEKGYDDVEVYAHGGLTFADRCRPSSEGEHKGVCHSDKTAVNATVWWLGFDCAHAGDFVPAYDGDGYHDSYDSYKNFGYVKNQVESLANQLSESTQR